MTEVISMEIPRIMAVFRNINLGILLKCDFFFSRYLHSLFNYEDMNPAVLEKQMRMMIS